MRKSDLSKRNHTVTSNHQITSISGEKKFAIITKLKSADFRSAIEHACVASAKRQNPSANALPVIHPTTNNSQFYNFLDNWKKYLVGFSDHEFIINSSVNDYINKKEYSLSYITIDTIVQGIRASGENTRIAKLDLAEAFKQIRVRQED